MKLTEILPTASQILNIIYLSCNILLHSFRKYSFPVQNNLEKEKLSAKFLRPNSSWESVLTTQDFCSYQFMVQYLGIELNWNYVGQMVNSGDVGHIPYGSQGKWRKLGKFCNSRHCNPFKSCFIKKILMLIIMEDIMQIQIILDGAKFREAKVQLRSCLI